MGNLFSVWTVSRLCCAFSVAATHRIWKGKSSLFLYLSIPLTAKSGLRARFRLTMQLCSPISHILDDSFDSHHPSRNRDKQCPDQKSSRFSRQYNGTRTSRLLQAAWRCIMVIRIHWTGIKVSSKSVKQQLSTPNNTHERNPLIESHR